MRKRLLVFAAMFSVLLPMAAQATVWQIGAAVNTGGGNIVVRGGTPQTYGGTVFRSYTTHANVPITVNANTGYQVSAVKVNGVAQSLPIPSGSNYNFNIASGLSQSFSASFTAQQLAVSSTSGPGGYVTPSGSWTYYYGTQSTPIVFTFVPNTGNQVIAINGLPASGYTLTDATVGGAVTLPAPVSHKVKVTITTLTAPVSLSGSFVSVVANAGTPQTVLTNTAVTLDASATTPAGATLVWSQTGGPAVSLSSTTAAQPSFMPPTTGTYYFQVTASSSGATSTASTTVTVTTSAAVAAMNQCVTCHNSIGVGPGIYSNWSSSVHEANMVMCAGCHVGNDTGSHPGTVNSTTVNPGTYVLTGSANGYAVGTLFCQQCHGNGVSAAVPHATSGSALSGLTCANCHTGDNGAGTGDAHGIKDPVATSFTESQCQNCHADATTVASVTAKVTTTPAPNYNVVSGYNASVHKLGESFASSCAGCHTGSAAAGNHPDVSTYSNNIDPTTFMATNGVQGGEGTYVPAGTVFCASCHKNTYAIPHLYPGDAKGTKASDFYVSCNKCHTDATGQTLGTGDAHNIQPLPGCVDCHSVAQANVAKGMVNDNNGVRQIVGAGGEFKQWSHHIINDTNNTTDPVNAQCIICHAEGTLKTSYGTTSVVVDGTRHMVDGNIHLRDCNSSLDYTTDNAPNSTNKHSQGTDGIYEFLWNPAAPNHTTMDQFCMSCHNANGAATAFSNLSTLGLKKFSTPAGKQFSALNPFGDLIQNNYDGLFRNAVVPVFDQFDPSNTSHHAVRKNRYTANTANTLSTNTISKFPQGVVKVNPTSENQAIFANISANNVAHGFPTTPGIPTVVNIDGPAPVLSLKYADGTSYVGTMADTGKFITTYKPLVDANADGTYTNTFTKLADNAQLHCGDCHTVGQWAARGTAAFQAYSAAFGPGVTRYYKTAIGAHGAKTEYMLRNGKDGDNAIQPQYPVCYNCHSEKLYSSGNATAAKVTVGTGAGNPALGLTREQSLVLYNYTGFRKAGGLMYQSSTNSNYPYYQLGAAASNYAGHDGVSQTSLTSHCDGDDNNTAGLTGLARLNSASSGTGLKETNAQFLTYTSGKAAGGTPSGGNALGIKCLNCHNSGDGHLPGYGGIHGNAFRTSDGPNGDTTVVRNVGYQAYSSQAVSSSSKKTAEHKPYRFLPGLGNFRFNGSAGSYDWTMYQVQANGIIQSCYTLNNKVNNSVTGTTGTVGLNSPTYPKNAPLSQTPLTSKTSRYANETDDDNGLLGTWGSCTDHAQIPTHYVPKRNVLRPTSY
ncbi:MAG TPA: hypothetical protein VI298_03040 [Geobacteraceae bacterium]